MLKRIALILVLCLSAGAVVPQSHREAGDRHDGRSIAALAHHARAAEWGSRRDRDAGSYRITSAFWRHEVADRPVSDTPGAPDTHRTRCAGTFPSYQLATHLSL